MSAYGYARQQGMNPLYAADFTVWRWFIQPRGSVEDSLTSYRTFMMRWHLLKS
jgi:hypothetical protein